jgi:hypothetical protein
MPFSLISSVLSLSPQFAISLSPSLCTHCLIPCYVLPVVNSHKKHMMYVYDYHWLTINIWGCTCCFTGNLLTIIYIYIYIYIYIMCVCVCVCIYINVCVFVLKKQNQFSVLIVDWACTIDWVRKNFTTSWVYNIFIVLVKMLLPFI